MNIELANDLNKAVGSRTIEKDGRTLKVTNEIQKELIIASGIDGLAWINRYAKNLRDIFNKMEADGRSIVKEREENQDFLGELQRKLYD